ncbi:MAG: hypothetical protein ACK5GI_04595 [Ignavibacteria bacterium]|jgi:hypothetical protein
MNDLYKSLNLTPYCSLELVREAIEHRNDAIAQRARAILVDPAKKKAYDHAHYATARIVDIRRSLDLLNTPHWDNSRYRDWNPVVQDSRESDRYSENSKSTNFAGSKIADNDTNSKIFRGFVALVFLVIIYGSCVNRDYESESTVSSGISEQTSGSEERALDIPIATSQERPREVDLPVVSRPRHNRLFRAKGNPESSLTIRTTDGTDYYIKLVDVAGNKTIRSAYIHGGMVGEIPVPLGEYYLYWSSGKDWYGPKHGFGKDAPKQKGSSTLNFERNGNRIRSWEVTLYNVPNGNMSQESVDDSDFDQLDD